MTPEQHFFRAIPQLAALGNDQISDLAKRTDKRKYRKGEYIFFQNDNVEHIYFLEMGKIEIYKSDANGRKLTLWHIEENEIFALATFFSQQAFASAQAVQDSLVFSLSRKHFEEIIAASDDLSRNLISCICGKMATYSSLLDDLAFRKIEVRLAKTILRNLDSQKGQDPVCQLNQEELASMIGTSREVVGRCLKTFRERDIVSISKKGRPRLIIIRQFNALEELANT